VIQPWIDESFPALAAFPCADGVKTVATPLACTIFPASPHRAISSVVERLLHTQEVAGSNPASRTISLLGKIRQTCDVRHLKTTADVKNAELNAYSSQLSDLTAAERADSQRAFEILRAHAEVTLTDLAKEYVRQAAIRSASKPIDEFLDEYKAQLQARVDSGDSHPITSRTFKKPRSWQSLRDELSHAQTQVQKLSGSEEALDSRIRDLCQERQNSELKSRK
jgi:hypothetical protein